MNQSERTHGTNGRHTTSSRVLYVQYTNPAAWPPVEHSARILLDAGFEVLLLGTENLGHEFRLPPHARMRMRLMPFEAGGWRQKWHYVRFAAWVLLWAMRWRPTWVYASDPLSCPIAVMLRGLCRFRVVYHEHDSPAPVGEEAAPLSLFMKVALSARRVLAQRAELCVLPNERRAAQFEHETHCNHVLVVWNCPSRAEIVDPRPERKPSSLRLWYHGTIVPVRIPLTVVESLAELPPEVTLEIAGWETIGQLGYVKQLTEFAEKLGVAGRVSVRGAVPKRAELLRGCAANDVGLSLMPIDGADINTREMAGASSKAFEYMACGLALLVSDLPDWHAMYVTRGYGLACDPRSSASVAKALRWFLEHPRETREMGERGRRQIGEHWNYERTFAPVVARLTGSAADSHERRPLEVVGTS